MYNMKKIFAIAAVAVLALSTLTLNAQNSFKGIVKYSVASTGEVAIDIPEQSATGEMKVYDDRVLTSSIVFTNSPMVNSVMQSGRTLYTFLDFGMVLGYFQAHDVELTSYNGDGKIIQKHTVTQTDIDSLTIPVDKGYYIEYVAGQTKKIAGRDGKLARLHVFDDEGKDKVIDIWYDDTMGPEANFLAQGVRGIPLEYTVTMDGGKAITITAVEVTKGKVKEVDFLMPDGFKELPEDQFKAFMEEFQEEMELLQEE